MRRAWTGLALFALVAMWAVVLALWASAPERVPSHFNAAGEADRWTGPYRLWFMPAAATPLFLLLLTISNLQAKTGDPARVALADGLASTNGLVMVGSFWMHAEVWMLAMGFVGTPGPASFLSTTAAGVFGLGFTWWRYRLLRRKRA